MATAKLGTLVIRTLAKPISNRLKVQAKDHKTFRHVCVSLAQWMHRGEVTLRTGLLGEPAKSIRPLSETRAIENGANALAEGFLFAVAALLILAETYRSSRSSSKRREDVDDQLETLANNVSDLTKRLDAYIARAEADAEFERQRHEELSRILERVVEIGLRGGWAEFEEGPIKFPRTSLTHPSPRDPPNPEDGSDSSGPSSAGTPSSPTGSSPSPPPTSSDPSAPASHKRVSSGSNRDNNTDERSSYLGVMRAEFARRRQEQDNARGAGPTGPPAQFVSSPAWNVTKSHLLTQALAAADWDLHEEAMNIHFDQPNNFTPEVAI